MIRTTGNMMAHHRFARVPRRDKTTITPSDARGATPRRWRSAAVLLSSMMTAVGAVAGCGNNETSAGSERAAKSTPVQETRSNSKPTTDPTGNTYNASSEPHDTRIEIAIKDIAFKPQYITARVGQTLVFTNRDDVAHKIKGQEGQYYTSKRLSPGQTFEYKIKKDPQLKSMAFICSIHPETKGGAVVTK